MKKITRTHHANFIHLNQDWLISTIKIFYDKVKGKIRISFVNQNTFDSYMYTTRKPSWTHVDEYKIKKKNTSKGSTVYEIDK